MLNCSVFRRLASASVICFLSFCEAQAVDLLYVSLGNGSIVTYDVSLTTGSAVSASLATFTTTNVNNPQGLAFDASGNLYVANNGDSTISKFGPGAALLGTISTNLSSPGALAIDPSGNVYARGLGGTISKFNSAGAFQSSITGPSSGLATDTAGNLYASDYISSTITKFNTSGSAVLTINTGLNGPIGLATDASGKLFAANQSGSSISVYSSAGVLDSTITGNMLAPNGIALDSSGNIYVTNGVGSTISKFNSSGLFQFGWVTTAAPLFVAVKPTIVPEPSTWVLGALAVSALVVVKRRTRK
ncbi:MAG: NHL repeat-containing protein [bacterium]